MSAIEIPGYKIVRTLGVGGQATVYLAIQQGFDREVALKVMSPALAADPTFGERFLREAKIVAKLSHKSIVTVYDVGESGNFYYLAMEYMAGGDLKSRIANGMKARESLDIISKVAVALHFAHDKGYIHRDVKSENILFDLDGEPVLTDFGIAKASNSSTQMTQTGKLIGTPEYMSPEQCRGKKVDGRSDLYSIGIILYEMLTKGVPFTGEDSVAVCIKHVTKPVPKLPVRLKHFQWLLDFLLAKNPQERFQTGKELAKVIDNFKKTGKEGAVDTSVTQQASKSNAKTVVQESEFIADREELQFDDNFDDLHTERREFEPEKSKSRLSLFASVLLVAVLGIGGYMTQAQWLPKVTLLIEENFGDGSKQSKSANINAENVKKPMAEEVSPEPQSVEKLLRDADTLVQFVPHKMEDMKQALNLIATVNTLDKNNPNADLIYKNIINVSLSEAVTLAQENEFENAEQWIKLVEYEQPNHPLLAPTKQKVQQQQQDYQTQLAQIDQQSQKIRTLLEKADTAINEKRLSAPEDDNAIAYLEQVLKLDPENIDAKAGQQKVVAAYDKMIETAIAENQYSQARSMLNWYGKLSSDEGRKLALRQKIKLKEQAYKIELKERQRLAAIEDKKKQVAQARQAKLSDPLLQMQLQSSMTKAETLEAQGILFGQNGDNAIQKFNKVLEVDEQSQAAKTGLIRIEGKITEELTSAINENRKLDAQHWLKGLVELEKPLDLIESYEQRINEIIQPEAKQAGFDEEADSDATLGEESLEQDASTDNTDSSVNDPLSEQGGQALELNDESLAPVEAGDESIAVEGEVQIVDPAQTAAEDKEDVLGDEPPY